MQRLTAFWRPLTAAHFGVGVRSRTAVSRQIRRFGHELQWRYSAVSADLNPGVPSEYIELRVRRSSAIGGQRETLARCAGATDPAGCEGDYLALDSSRGFPFGDVGKRFAKRSSR